MLIHNTKKLPARIYHSKDGKKYLPARLMYSGKIGSGYEIKSETGEEITLKGDYNDALIDFCIDGGGVQSGTPSTESPAEIMHFNGTLLLDGSPLSPSLPPLCKIGGLGDSIEIKDGRVTFEQKIGSSDCRMLDLVADFRGDSIGHVNNFTNWEITETGFKQTKKNDTNSYFRQPVYDITNLVEPNTTYFLYRNLSRNFSVSNSTTDAYVGSILLYSGNTRLATAYRWEKFLIFTTPEKFDNLQILTYTVPSNSVIKEYTAGTDSTQFFMEWSDVGLYIPAKPNSAYLGTMTSGGKTDTQGVFTINQGEVVKYQLADPITTDLTDTPIGQMLLGINTEHGKDKTLSAPNGIIHARQYVYSE